MTYSVNVMKDKVVVCLHGDPLFALDGETEDVLKARADSYVSSMTMLNMTFKIEYRRILAEEYPGRFSLPLERDLQLSAEWTQKYVDAVSMTGVRKAIVARDHRVAAASDASQEQARPAPKGTLKNAIAEADAAIRAMHGASLVAKI